MKDDKIKAEHQTDLTVETGHDQNIDELGSGDIEEDTKTEKSRTTNVSHLSIKLKEQATKDRVKALIKRGETESHHSQHSLHSAKKSVNSKSKQLLDKMSQKVLEFPDDNLANVNPESNPLLKQGTKNLTALSKSKSDKSLVSNSKLGK